MGLFHRTLLRGFANSFSYPISHKSLRDLDPARSPHTSFLAGRDFSATLFKLRLWGQSSSLTPSHGTDVIIGKLPGFAGPHMESWRRLRAGFNVQSMLKKYYCDSATGEF